MSFFDLEYYAIDDDTRRCARGRSNSDTTLQEKDAIGVYCSAVGADWRKGWHMPNPRPERITVVYCGHEYCSSWSQDSVWLLATVYWQAKEQNRLAMRLPSDDNEALAFMQRAEWFLTGYRYNAVKKYLRFHYGPQWHSYLRELHMLRALHEVAAMADGRMEVERSADTAAEKRMTYYARLHDVSQREGAYGTSLRKLAQLEGCERGFLRDGRYDVCVPRPPTASPLAQPALPQPQAPAPPQPQAPQPTSVHVPPTPALALPPPVAPAEPMLIEPPVQVPPAAVAALHEMAAALGHRVVHQAGITCSVCLDKPPEMASVPCGHLCLCMRCSGHQTWQECPICRQRVERIMRIFT